MKTVKLDSGVAFWSDELKLITSDNDGKEALLGKDTAYNQMAAFEWLKS